MPSTSRASASHASKVPPFNDLKNVFKRENLYSYDWSVNVSNTNKITEMCEEGYLIPKYYIQIDETLEVAVSVYGFTVPNTSVLFPWGICTYYANTRPCTICYLVLRSALELLSRKKLVPNKHFCRLSC